MKSNPALSMLLIVATSCSVMAQRKIQVPYFNTLSGNEICGSPNCNPQIGTWAPIQGGYLFDGDPKKIFGRKFSSKNGIFDNSPCASRIPNDTEFKTLKKGSLKGTLDIQKKKDFESKIGADLVKIINQYVNVNETVKANLLADLKRAIEEKSTSTVDLEYRIIQVENDYLDNEIEQCRKTLGSKDRVIVGVSVLTVSGTWTSNTLKDVFNKFEANLAAFNALDANTKAKYELSKKRVLDAQYDTFSMVFNVSYKFKP